MWNSYKLFCRVNGLVEGNFKSLEMWYISYNTRGVNHE